MAKLTETEFTQPLARKLLSVDRVVIQLHIAPPNVLPKISVLKISLKQGVFTGILFTIGFGGSTLGGIFGGAKMQLNRHPWFNSRACSDIHPAWQLVLPGTRITMPDSTLLAGWPVQPDTRMLAPSITVHYEPPSL